MLPRQVVDGGGFEDAPLIGGNLRAHLDHLEKEMREAAANLEFEEAARIRDEIKRLQDVELTVADDPFAREESERGFKGAGRSGKRKGSGRIKKSEGTVSTLLSKPKGKRK